MTIGHGSLTSVGIGAAYQSSASASAMTAITPNGSTSTGDYVFLIVYANGSLEGASDSGAGWQRLAVYYNAADSVSLLAAVVRARGTAAIDGFNFGATLGYMAQTWTARMSEREWYLDIQNARWDTNAFYASASGTPGSVPAYSQGYSDCLSVFFRGGTNAGTRRASGTITLQDSISNTEVLDAGLTTPVTFDAYMNYSQIRAPLTMPLVSGAISTGISKRIGFRVAIPMVKATYFPNRMVMTRFG